MIRNGDYITCIKPLSGFLRVGKRYLAIGNEFQIPVGFPKVQLVDDKGRSAMYPTSYFEHFSKAPVLAITAEKRLELINQQLAGMQTPGYIANEYQRSNHITQAIAYVDELLMQTGFTILE